MIFKSSPEIFSTRSTQLRCLIKTSSKSKANNSVLLELNFEQRRANKANIILAKKMLAHSPIAGKYSVMLSARVVAAHFARHVRQYSTFFEIFKIEICFSRERERVDSCSLLEVPTRTLERGDDEEEEDDDDDDDDDEEENEVPS